MPKYLTSKPLNKHNRLSVLLRPGTNYSNSSFQSPSSIPRPREPSSTNTKTGSYLVFLNSQITNHGRHGHLDEARSVFDRMPFRDAVSWTALLTAYANNGQLSNARKVFDEMPQKNSASWNAMMAAYVRSSKFNEAFELFSQMPEKNVISYGTMISGFARVGMVREAKKVYMEMPPTWRDPVGSNGLIHGYLRNGELDKAVQVFNGMTVRDVISWSSILDGYCKNGRVVDAREIFEMMPEKNVVSWTAMIRGYFKAGIWEDGFLLFMRMRREQVLINSTTLSVLLDACADPGSSLEGIQIHGLILKMGFDGDVFLGNSLIVMYSRSGWMVAARTVFDGICHKDVVSWNTVISGYVQHDKLEEANVLFESMPEKDAVSWTSMIVGFSKRRWIREAVRLFEAIPVKDDVAWTAIISGFAGNGEYERAFRWFYRMLQKGIRPNPFVLSSVLSALAGLAILDQGVQVHTFIVKMKLEFDVNLQSSLVSMYAKCGNVADSYQIFSSMNEPNLVIINSMITGFAQHGLAKEALKLFDKMVANGCEPNHVTFLGVLSACSCAGLVEEGYRYFKSMNSYYGIEPGPDHYTCMVDLFGRAGLLKEAMYLINSMPFEPHAAMWGALLHASKMHYDLDLAKLAAQQLFELEPKNGTTYAALSNMYSLAGMIEDEKELRTLKQSNGGRKNPGYSWITFGNTRNQPTVAC